MGSTVGWRCEVDFGFDQVEKLLALLVRHAILAIRALTRIAAEEACAEAVTVELEAA